jgi:uncharacterized protein
MTNTALAATTITAATTAAEPDGAPRLPSLDILRGIAILGILFMNINDMGASLNASFGDFRHLGWTRADQVAWWLREVVASGTARGMLEMLFGAGMVILTGRLMDADRHWAALKRYYWRNLVLLGFGLVHIFILLWPGDILHSYALAALLVFPLRGLRPRLLIVLGLAMATLQLVGGTFDYVQTGRSIAAYDSAQVAQAASRPLTKEQKDAVDRRAKREQRLVRETRLIATEDAARTGSAASWVRWQWHQEFALQGKGIEVFIVWEAASLMLLGAALFKLGWLQGDRPARWYAHAALATYLFAFAMRVPMAQEMTRFGVFPHLSQIFSEYGRIAMTLGHVFLVNWLLASGAGARALALFRAAGQTALSLYIAQTILCLWVLYPPWGLALYGRSGWAGLMLTALAINAALLLLANWWVRRYRIAPVEWAWRSIVAGQRLPIRREVKGAGPVPLPVG